MNALKVLSDTNKKEFAVYLELISGELCLYTVGLVDFI